MYSRFQFKTFKLGHGGTVTAQAGATRRITGTLALGLGLGRCIGVTRNSLGFVQIPVLSAMVEVVQLLENFLD